MELTVHYDADTAFHDFQESLKRINDSSGRCDEFFEFTDYGNITPSCDGSFEDLYNFKNADKQEIFAILHAELGENYTGFEGMREFIRDYDLAGDQLAAFAQHLEFSFSLSDYVADDISLADEVGATRKFHVIETRGYCQGDYAAVLVNIAEFQKLTGHKFNDKDIANIQTDIDHLFWDQPIRAQLDCGTETIFLDKMLSDRYRWDTDEILKNLKGYSKQVIDFLKENLPSEPDYA